MLGNSIYSKGKYFCDFEFKKTSKNIVSQKLKLTSRPRINRYPTPYLFVYKTLRKKIVNLLLKSSKSTFVSTIVREKMKYRTFFEEQKNEILINLELKKKRSRFPN